MDQAMNFEEGKVYTHRNMLDAAILVLSVRELEAGHSMDVRWVTKRGLDLGHYDKDLFVPKSAEGWKELEEFYVGAY